MKGKWYVMKNPMAGYIVARVKDTSETVHSGNLECITGTQPLIKLERWQRCEDKRF